METNFQKTIKFCLLIASIMFVIACSKDDEPKISNPLKGIWQNESSEWGYNYTRTFIFNSNGTFEFVWTEYKNNSNINSSDTLKGKYSIYQKNKVIFSITYNSAYENPNVDEYSIVIYEIFKDYKGEHFILDNDDEHRYYKK
ncbi:MAG: hypothetical protein FWG85_00685 [Bacteroidetes bacterium]|nr:hypothetical protein [Bacteroidota bacterium]